MKIRIIGDVHGKVELYRYIITDKNCPQLTFQLGDFGFKWAWDWLTANDIDPERHHVMMGNHDYYPYLMEHPNSVCDFNSWFEDTFFYVRGADSVDKHLRREGGDWFPEEEMDVETASMCLDEYVITKPRMVVSHDCPQLIMEQLFGYNEKSRTRHLLQSMLDAHKPDVWVFGHHHQDIDIVIDGVRFICLNELSYIDLDIPLVNTSLTIKNLHRTIY